MSEIEIKQAEMEVRRSQREVEVALDHVAMSVEATSQRVNEVVERIQRPIDRVQDRIARTRAMVDRTRTRAIALRDMGVHHLNRADRAAYRILDQTSSRVPPMTREFAQQVVDNRVFLMQLAGAMLGGALVGAGATMFIRRRIAEFSDHGAVVTTEVVAAPVVRRRYVRFFTVTPPAGKDQDQAA